MMHVSVVATYVLLLIGIAVYKSRNVKSADDFIVAGRSVPVYMLVATLVCTWIGSGSLFGTAGLTFRTGISELWFSSGAWLGILVIYSIAARVRRIAQYTLTDLLEKRYSQLAKVLGTITIIIAYMVIAGYQFKGGGRADRLCADRRFHSTGGHGVDSLDRHLQRQHHAAGDDRYPTLRDSLARWCGRRCYYHSTDRAKSLIDDGRA
jgi:hypothetical protein